MNIFLAKRYARAYDGVSKTAKAAQVNLQAYQDALASLADAAVYIKNPAIPQSVKADILDKILPSKTAAAGAAHFAESFLKIIVAHKRFDLADLIALEIQNCLDERTGVKRIEVQTAAAPQKDEALENALSKFFNAKIAAQYRQNPALLAGLKIRQGDILIDGSAAGRIERLKKNLIGN